MDFFAWLPVHIPILDHFDNLLMHFTGDFKWVEILINEFLRSTLVKVTNN